MPYAIEFSYDSESDFDQIYDHLFDSYLQFGDSREVAIDRAEKRIRDIRKAADQLAEFPNRGTPRNDVVKGARFLTIDRAIYWYDVDEDSKTVKILSVFFGGQDHVQHMLVRTLRENM